MKNELYNYWRPVDVDGFVRYDVLGAINVAIFGRCRLGSYLKNPIIFDELLKRSMNLIGPPLIV